MYSPYKQDRGSTSQMMAGNRTRAGSRLFGNLQVLGVVRLQRFTLSNELRHLHFLFLQRLHHGFLLLTRLTLQSLLQARGLDGSRACRFNFLL
jgi:hypothetical protein